MTRDHKLALACFSAPFVVLFLLLSWFNGFGPTLAIFALSFVGVAAFLIGTVGTAYFLRRAK